MRLITIIALALILSACSSHKKEKAAIEKEAATTNVSDSQGLGKTIHDLISNSKTLNEKQKKELTDILSQNKSKAEALSAESYKYRAVLIRELLTGKATDSSIKILEKTISRIENERLKNTFDTVKKISTIVELHPQLHDDIVNHMMNVDGRGSMVK
jgi:hypothetical protein